MPRMCNKSDSSYNELYKLHLYTILVKSLVWFEEHLCTVNVFQSHTLLKRCAYSSKKHKIGETSLQYIQQNMNVSYHA